MHRSVPVLLAAGVIASAVAVVSVSAGQKPPARGPGTSAGQATSNAATPTATNSSPTASASRPVIKKPGNAKPAKIVGPYFTVSKVGGSYRAVKGKTTYTGSLKYVGEAAVRNLNATGGGTVKFTKGTFNLGSEYFLFGQPLRNITFAGDGRRATLIKNKTNKAEDTEPFNFHGTHKVTVRDLTVSAGGSARSSSDAIDFDKGNHSRVINVGIIASRGRGIVFDGKDHDYTADHNEVANCVISGINSDGVDFLASNHNKVTGCHISNIGGTGIGAINASARAAQKHKKASYNVIRGNRIDQAGRDGILIKGGDRNRVEKNWVTNSSDEVERRDGIRILALDGVTAIGNVVAANFVEDNQIEPTQRYGLNISSPQCKRTVVRGNSFEGNRVGAVQDLGTASRVR
jgi:parallel beta-helix repeat protein